MLTAGRWVGPDGAVLARRLPERTPVERLVTWRGVEVYLISRDQRFYYVNVTGELPADFLVEQSQVGPREYRGQIPIHDLTL